MTVAVFCKYLGSSLRSLCQLNKFFYLLLSEAEPATDAQVQLIFVGSVIRNMQQ